MTLKDALNEVNNEKRLEAETQFKNTVRQVMNNIIANNANIAKYLESNAKLKEQLKNLEQATYTDIEI